MAITVIMPALGMAQDTGRVLAWFKHAGDAVEKGELLLEIETDKATVTLEAAASGILSEVTAQAGEDVPVGQTIAKILTSEEARAAQSPVQAETKRVVESTALPANGDEHEKEISAHSISAPVELPPSAAYRLTPASPKARRVAQERGIDLTTIKGTGPFQAVLETDLLAIPSPKSTTTPPPPQTANVGTIWRLMAERTTSSWVTTPHFYLQREVNATRLVAWRAIAQKRYGIKISYTDLLLNLTSYALQKHPRLNASWSNNAIVLNPDVNVGIAVAVPDGLVVPVVHRTDKKSLREIAAEREQLTERARAGKLTLTDVEGGTFTISNLGMYDVDAFSAIINSPQAAILAVGRIAERIVPVAGRVLIQPMLTLTLSCDHRIVDGATAAEFLRTCADLIQEPLMLLD